MGIIVEFFAAPDDVPAAPALQTGPRRAFESLSFGNVDPEEAVVEWECFLAGGSSEELVEVCEPRIVAGQGDDGCVVFALSSRLAAALAEEDVAALPGPGPGKRIFSSTGMNWVQSARRPGVTIRDSGRQRPSAPGGSCW
ncbi:hypothetical protein ACFXPY_13605 [Streptomyces sp. NPDC059153]|uniref:hypothetical protein n=1 Tax=unclassified Streptomyces TaxID=2593676 RepID=UPI00369AD99E